MLEEAQERSAEVAARGEATRLSGGRARPPRDRILDAVIELCGELGYEGIAVRHILERAGASRGTFYNHFEDKDDCFAQAYEETTEWLYRRLMTLAKRQPEWRGQVRVGLAELLEFCANRPAVAKAVFVDVHAAGGRALAQHDLLMSRLATAIDAAREDAAAGFSPPASTAEFMVGAIETLIAGKLSGGDAATAPDLLPGILHFVVLQYYGPEAAWDEMASAPAALWTARRRATAELP